MKYPPNKYSHLFNDLPYEERYRIYPFLVEAEYLHVWQEKQKTIAAHKAHMTAINSKLKILQSALDRIENNE